MAKRNRPVRCTQANSSNAARHDKRKGATERTKIDRNGTAYSNGNEKLYFCRTNTNIHVPLCAHVCGNSTFSARITDFLTHSLNFFLLVPLLLLRHTINAALSRNISHAESNCCVEHEFSCYNRRFQIRPDVTQIPNRLWRGLCVCGV